MLTAQYSENPEALNAFIKAGADVNAKENGGSTPLIIAVQHNSEEVTNALIKAGADVNAKNNDGSTPLMVAVYFDKSSGIVNALIEASADVNAKNKDRRTALSFAAEKREPEIVSLLLNAGADVYENDVESAQGNERLKDTAIIEELKQRAIHFDFTLLYIGALLLLFVAVNLALAIKRRGKTKKLYNAGK